MAELAGRKHVDLEELVAAYMATPTPDLKDVIIVHCSGLVEKIARRFSGIEPLEDLTQVGYVGLLNALSKFDPVAGVKFNTYATHLVAGEIKHYLRDRSLPRVAVGVGPADCPMLSPDEGPDARERG